MRRARYAYADRLLLACAGNRQLCDRTLIRFKPTVSYLAHSGLLRIANIRWGENTAIDPLRTVVVPSRKRPVA